jgi:hypothetical protein
VGGITSELDDLWDEVVGQQGHPGDGPYWMYRLSPPMPLSWPPHVAGEWAAYGMPFAVDPALADAEQVAEPFGRLLMGSGEPSVERLTDSLEGITTLGVAMLTPDQAHLITDADLDVMAAACHDAAVDVSALAPVYRLWFERNGPPTASVAARHPEVARWCRGDG